MPFTISSLYSTWSNTTQEHSWANCPSASNMVRTPKSHHTDSDDLTSELQRSCHQNGKLVNLSFHPLSFLSNLAVEGPSSIPKPFYRSPHFQAAPISVCPEVPARGHPTGFPAIRLGPRGRAHLQTTDGNTMPEPPAA